MLLEEKVELLIKVILYNDGELLILFYLVH